MNLFANGQASPDNGYYENIRSSEHASAMLGWDTIKYDYNSKRWIESNSIVFNSRETAFALEDEIGTQIDDFESTYEDICVRESSWEVSCRQEDETIAEAHFYMTEKRYGEIHSLNFNLSNVSRQELEDYKSAIYNWHTTGRVSMGSFDCVPFWFYND